MADQDDVQQEWLSYSCPVCHSLFRVTADDRGHRAECPNCHQLVLIPSGDAEDPGVGEGTGRPSSQGRVDGAQDQARTLEDQAEESMPRFRHADESEVNPDDRSEPASRRKVRRVRRKVSKKPIEDPTPLDWELSGGHQVTTAESMSVLRPLLVAGLAALILMIGIVVVKRHWEGPRRGGDLEQPRSVEAMPIPEQPPPSKVEEVSKMDLRSDLQLIRDVAREFLGAQSVDEFLPLLRSGGASEEAIRAYHRRHPWKPIVPREVAPSSRIVRSGDFWAVDVELPDFRLSALAVKKEAGRFRVDWDSWVGYSEVPWEEMPVERPTAPFLIRAYVLPVEYYNFQFTDEKKWVCYSLQSPDRERNLYGYVERLSVKQSMLENFESQDRELAYLLRVRYPAQPTGKDQVIIDEVLDAGWISDRTNRQTASTEGLR